MRERKVEKVRESKGNVKETYLTKLLSKSPGWLIEPLADGGTKSVCKNAMNERESDELCIYIYNDDKIRLWYNVQCNYINYVHYHVF